MRKIIFTILLAAISAVSIHSATAPLPPRKTITAAKADGKIKIDGKLDEKSWVAAPDMDFVFITGVSSPPRQATKAKVAVDDDNLYIAVVCDETEMEQLLSNTAKRDGAVWEDDCVEIFIDSNRDEKTYHHFIINPAGTIFDAKDGKGAWNCAGIEVMTAKNENGWTVEARIPRQAVGVEPGAESVGLNVNRLRSAKPGGGHEDSCWSPIGRWSGKVPERFGVVNL